MARASLVMIVLASLAGCGGGESGADGGRDGATRADGSMGDAGTVMCGAGQHPCGASCMDLQPNNPANGCALGCGTPCPGAMASCNPDGTCSTTSCVPTTSCIAMSAECGIIETGCGRMNCGDCNTLANEMCVGGQCICSTTPDSHEPNESNRTVTSSGSVSDDPDEPITDATLNGTFHTSSDVDWFRFDIVDEEFGDGTNPNIYITLSGVPAGSEYEMVGFFDARDCDLTDNLTDCAEGADDSSLANDTDQARGCRTTSTGADASVRLLTECDWDTDEHGTLWIRVRALSMGAACGGYTVTLDVR
jgi:hypothetical protein